MVLVDKEIKARSSEIFKKNYDPRHVQPISYDIYIDQIISENENVTTFTLEPHEVVMVRCKEEVHVPHDLIIRIENKNSMIRWGLTVTAPVYNPGHTTPVYLRVENVSGNNVTIEQDMAIAQMLFEKLSDVPEKTYDQKQNASFNDEEQYRGLGNYSEALEKKRHKIEKERENLENKESTIYANILTMMGIFVSIFSLITVNFSSINESNFSKDFILTMNLSLGIVITLFMGLILFFLNKNKNKYAVYIFIAILILLILLLLFII